MIISQGFGYSGTVITLGYGTALTVAEALTLISHIATSLSIDSNI